MYQTKTDRQVRYVPQLDEGKTFCHQHKYPLQVGIGLLAHQQMRSKSVIDVLHELDVSVNYAGTLRIETQVVEAVLSNSSEHIFIPPKLCKGQFIFLVLTIPFLRRHPRQKEHTSCNRKMTRRGR